MTCNVVLVSGVQKNNLVTHVYTSWGFPCGSDSKASAYDAGNLGSIPSLGRSLEKEMAAHSSTLAWKIPWVEEPGRLQPMGSQRVGHN